MKEASQSESMAIAREKQDLIFEFQRLTEVQSEQIEADNYDSILQIINQKQSIIEKVNCLDLKAQVITRGEDQQVEDVRAATQEILAIALEMEKQNIAAIKANQAQVFTKLKNARINQVTHAAYRGTRIAVEGTLVDQKK